MKTEAIIETLNRIVRNHTLSREETAAVSAAIGILENRTWIPVSEKLPEDGKRVLIAQRNSPLVGSGIDIDFCVHKHPHGWAHHTHRDDSVTHWMPLPAAPWEEA